jgi:hypothetical protein
MQGLILAVFMKVPQVLATSLPPATVRDLMQASATALLAAAFVSVGG